MKIIEVIKTMSGFEIFTTAACLAVFVCCFIYIAVDMHKKKKNKEKK